MTFFSTTVDDQTHQAHAKKTGKQLNTGVLFLGTSVATVRRSNP